MCRTRLRAEPRAPRAGRRIAGRRVSLAGGFFVLALMLACRAAPKEVVELDGRAVDPFSGAALTAFIFMRTDCPISSRYAPALARIHDAFASRGVRFSLVFADPRDDAAAIRSYLDRFSLKGTILRDPHQLLVRELGVRVTPEAAIADASHRRFYRGRIDDRFPNIRGAQTEVTRHDLENALSAALLGTESATTAAVGCAIAGVEL